MQVLKLVVWRYARMASGSVSPNRRIVMIRLALLVLVVPLVATPALAGTITLNFGAAQTITTTAAQDARLARVLQSVNATRDPANCTQPCNPQFATVEL